MLPCTFAQFHIAYHLLNPRKVTKQEERSSTPFDASSICFQVCSVVAVPSRHPSTLVAAYFLAAVYLRIIFPIAPVKVPCMPVSMFWYLLGLFACLPYHLMTCLATFIPYMSCSAHVSQFGTCLPVWAASLSAIDLQVPLLLFLQQPGHLPKVTRNSDLFPDPDGMIMRGAEIQSQC